MAQSADRLWQERSLRRAHWLAMIVLLLTVGLLGGLLGRVAWIEKHTTQEDLVRLDKQHDAVQPIMANRGQIRFEDGTVAAASVRMFNLYADPAFIIDPGGRLRELQDQVANLSESSQVAQGKAREKLLAQIEVTRSQIELTTAQLELARQTLAETLAPLLQKPADEVRKLILDNAAYPSGNPRRFLWLARYVDEGFHERFVARRDELKAQAQEIMKAAKAIKNKEAREKETLRGLTMAHSLDGVGFVESVQRRYPLGSLAGQVLGIANAYKGVDGLEVQLDPLLTGREGAVTMLKDARRHTLLVEDKQYRPPAHGLTVWLTIDTMIQNIVEEELAKSCEEHKAESGCAIILDPATGRILAMANWPMFDPGRYQEMPAEARKNRCIVDPYEPGSIFKPFVVAWALEQGVVRPSDVYDCHFGHWYDPTGRMVSDTHGGYGALTVEDILVKSSNIGMTQIGWKMGIPRLYEAVTRFGFGARTGVELPGDGKGLIRPLEKWNKGTLTSVSFGYEAAATPLQLVRAYATFANGGYLVTPQVIHAVQLESGKAVAWQDLSEPPLQKQIISTATAQTMRNIMEGVFMRGTARSAKSDVYRL
ncbi:MAG: penicillin-binding protein 2, partial [Phycisphaerae bacterium]